MYGVPVRRLRLLQNDHTPRDRRHRRRAGRASRIGRSGTRSAHDRETLGRPAAEPAAARLDDARACSRDCAAADGLRDRHLAQQRLAVPASWPGPGTTTSAACRRSSGRTSATGMSRLTKHRRAGARGAPRPAIHRGRLRRTRCGSRRRAGSARRARPSLRIRRSQRFYTRADRTRHAERGWLQLLFLKVGDRRIATSYGAGLRRPAVPVQDRLRPGVRDLLAVQAPHVLRDPATRTRRGSRKSTSSATPSRGSSNGRRRAAVARLAVRVLRHRCERGSCIRSSSSGCRS